jgi:Ca2+-binding EF-hand superfamily protein
VSIRRRIGGGGPEFNFKGGPYSDEKLAEFLAAHPTADADADGQLTPTERDAYLVVVAMSRPADVLKQFPSADRDQNGTLDLNESIRLVSGGIVFRTRVAAPAVIAAPAGAEHAETGTVIRKEVHAMAIAARVAGDMASALPASPKRLEETAAWLLENIPTVPTTADVAKMQKTVEEAPNAALLTEHPEADTNHDGKLSADEREAFFKQMEAQAARKMAERFPEADADGDGAVTPEELANYHLSRLPNGAAAPEGRGVRKMIFITHDEGGAGETEDVVIEKP